MKHVKNKMSNHLKLGILLLIIPLSLWNCEKDEILQENIVTHQDSKRPFIEKVTFEEIFLNEKIKSKLEKINYQGKKQSLDQTARILSIDGSFTVLTDRIQHMITEDIETYTFLIETPLIENASFSEFILERPLGEENYSMWVYNFTRNQDQFTVSRNQLSDDTVNLQDLNLNNRMAILGNCLYQVLEFSDGVMYILIECYGGGGSNSSDSDGDTSSGNTTDNTTGGDTSSSGDSSVSYNDGDASSSGGGGGGSTSSGSTSTSSTSPIFIPVIPTIEEILTEEYLDNLTPDQQACLDANPAIIDPSDPSNNTLSLEGQIIHFLQHNINPTPSLDSSGTVTVDPAIQFVDQAIEAVCNGGSVDFEELNIETIFFSSTWDSYPCHKGIIDNVLELNNPFLSSFKLAYQTDTENLNLVFSIDNLIGTNNTELDAYTDPISYCHSRIIFDPDFLNQSSNLGIMVTVFHEMIHSHLHAISDNPLNDNLTYNAMLIDYANHLIDNNLTTATTHHEIISNLVTQIGDAIIQYAQSKGYDTSDETPFRDLAWAGLFNSNTFNLYHPMGSASRVRIINRLIAERNDPSSTITTSQIITPTTDAPCN